MARSTRIQPFVGPLILDAVAAPAGGYALNRLTGDQPSPWWWALVAGCVVVVVASGMWAWLIERRHSESVVPPDAPAASSAVSGATATTVATSADSGDTSIASGGVSISAKNHSFAAWNVTGPVTLGGSQPPSTGERESRSHDGR